MLCSVCIGKATALFSELQIAGSFRKHFTTRQIGVTKELKGLWRTVFKIPKTFLGNLVKKDPDDFTSILSNVFI